MDALFEALATNIVISVIGVCFLTGMVLKAITNVVSSVVRERTRREIAAYIAEGSISPDQGERLLKADVSGGAGWAPKT